MIVADATTFNSGAITSTRRLSVRSRSLLNRVLLGAVVPLTVLLIWFGVTQLNLVPVQILPAPQVVAESLCNLIAHGDLGSNLAISLQRVAFGFLAGAVSGLVLGAAMGLSSRVDRFIRPTFMIISQVPILGWLPFLMMLLGIGEALKIVIIAKAAFTPVTINTLNGFQNVPRNYREVARIYGFTPAQLLRHVMVPAALPPIFTGLRYGLTHAWLALVVVELLASTEGVGYLMVWSRQLFQLDVTIAMMVVIGIVGFVMDKLLALGESRLLDRFGGTSR